MKAGEVEPVEIAGNRLVWRHIQRENQKMKLDPLGYDPPIDTDDHIKATMKSSDHKRWKENTAERR
jgi:hypothetical protein